MPCNSLFVEIRASRGGVLPAVPGVTQAMHENEAAKDRHVSPGAPPAAARRRGVVSTLRCVFWRPGPRQLQQTSWLSREYPGSGGGSGCGGGGCGGDGGGGGRDWLVGWRSGRWGKGLLLH